jgi:hypothetical protein
MYSIDFIICQTIQIRLNSIPFVNLTISQRDIALPQDLGFIPWLLPRIGPKRHTNVDSRANDRLKLNELLTTLRR